MLSDETIQSVRDRVDIAEIVGDRVKLQRKGRSLTGLCPFHKEKTPSFHVNEERGFYYCFGCHASGDAIKFVQETEGLGFLDAIRELATRLGIPIVENRSPEARTREEGERRRKDELYNINQAAAEFFERSLSEHPLGALARAELERRGLGTTRNPKAPEPTNALQAFRLGYAPYGWEELSVHLRQAGLSLKAAEQLGLVGARKQGGGFYDRFRHRLMFPVLDLRGRVVAFSGRALDEPDPELLQRHRIAPLGTRTDERVAKYMNSPESEVYRKRELVFGLYQARDTIRTEDRCIVVEGNFDVVSLHARGVNHVVAPLGTAFTSEQASQIRRYSANVTLLFDGDSAGQRASIAAREACKAAGVVPRVATLPRGSDPDDLIRQKGPEAILQCVRSAKGMLEYLIESTLDSGFQGADAETQGRKIQEVTQLIQSEEDPTVRAFAQAHADRIAARLGISDVRTFQALSRAIREASAAPRAARKPSVPSPERARSRGNPSAIEQAILGALVEYPALVSHPNVQELFKHVSGELALHVLHLVRLGDRLTERFSELDARLQPLVGLRLAAPELESENVAAKVLIDNLQKLATTDHRAEKQHTIEALMHAREVGDYEAQELLLNQQKEASLHQVFRRERNTVGQ